MATRLGEDGTPHSRIVVSGDGDFATNSFFAILGNGQLFLNLVNTLAGERDLVGIAPRNYMIAKLALTNRQVNAIFLLTTFVFPGLLLAMASVFWWRRARAGARGSRDA